MKYLKLFEDYDPASNVFYRALLSSYSAAELAHKNLLKSSSEADAKYFYYKECKKDPRKISPPLVENLAEECIRLDDIEFFTMLGTEYPLRVTSMVPFVNLFRKAAFSESTTFAKKLFQILSYESDGKERLKEVVKKCQPSPSKFEAPNLWILEFLFNEGIICVDGSKPIPYQIDFTQLPTKLIKRLAQDTVVTEENIDKICDQASWTDIEERMILFTSLPPVWEYLTKHPDVIDKKMGLATFGDFMPKAKAAEINHVRRGRQSGKKFGF